MNPKTRKLIAATTALAGLAAIAGSIAIAQPEKDARKGTPVAPAGQPNVNLPPGWNPEDMQAMATAATLGEMHEHLKKTIGVWQGKSKMWAGPGETESMDSDGTWTVTSVFDGRYIRADMATELPGLGAYKGIGYYGYDNVSKKFVASWLDTMSTGIMQGVGELSKDGKTLTWNYTYNCPIRKKPAVIREVHTFTGPDAMTFDAFTTDVKSGKEYKCMRIDLTRKAS